MKLLEEFDKFNDLCFVDAKHFLIGYLKALEAILFN